MSDKPLVSYVLTAYNIEEYIEESVNCAFAQTYEPLEIILSDDCSTDNTYEIMKKMATEYKGPHKIILNRNEQNLGITRHMNKAYLDLAHGGIIVVAHGDDISDCRRTGILVEYLQKNASCTQVANSATVCDSNMQPLNSQLQKNFRIGEIREYKLGSGAHVSVGFSAFRREVMTYFGRLQDSCPTEDDPIGFRAILLGKIAFLPDILTKYRKHEGSNSNPEKFAKFPLDEIYKQHLLDMQICVNNGLLAPEMYNAESERLYKGMEVRKVYRQYFAERTIKHLIKYIRLPEISFRGKLSAIKSHILYKLGIHE